jgi:ApeA-like protein/HEPN superfamily Apea-like protein
MTSFKLPDMGEDFSITGHWWMPGHSDKPEAGNLSSVGGRLTLEILGALPGIDPNKTYFKVPLIHGAAEAKAISLVDCYQAPSGFKVPGTIESRFYPDSIYFGEYLPDSERYFESWTSSLTDLGPWIGKEPVQQSLQTDNSGSLIRISHVYEPGSKNCFRIRSEGSGLEFGYGISTDGDPYRSMSFSYAAQLTIRPDTPKNADWFMHRLHRLNGMMSLLIGRSAHSRGVYARRTGESGRRDLYEVRVNHEPQRHIKDLGPHEILVPLSAVSTTLSDIADAWFKNDEKLEEPISLLLSAVYEHALSSHVRLLLLCQSLESFHRNIFGGCYLTQESYEPIKEVLTGAIPGAIPTSLKDSLKSRIRYGYQFSVLKRLNELHSLLQDSQLRKIGIEVATFTQQVKDARNYYTHWDPAGATNIAKGAALANLVSKLSAVSRIILLKHLSVDPELVIERMLSNKRIYLQEYRALD